ncbi:MAG: 2-oxoacid:acceptor oxidoreductase subunit alpha [Candidatus Anammoximicrobium sp.]|nr:2-oxoacid:acceptor oxidoreductase subunit alpha [Candidatus Anammoximicrobium sp.]
MVGASGPGKELIQVQHATVRFAGDSGDGMQLVGGQFADIASMSGSAICSFPDFPSDIRAPAGTLGGVSGYQLSFGDQRVTTPGDAPFVLVAMNPAALKVCLPELQQGGIVIANEDAFTPANLQKAEYEANPLEDGSLDDYRLIPVPMGRLTEEATAATGLPKTQRDRCKNFFALGVALWLYDRPLQPLLEWMMKKFARIPEVMAANAASLRAGHNFANTAELFRVHYQVARAELPPGRYRRVTGNEALALGCIVAAHRLARPLVYASYPITPASEVLHELAKHKEFDIRVIQAEDEIAACCAAIGASFAGAVGVTGTSGPGLSLKSEAIGLAVMTELPLVVLNVQRAGPSTGLPTKTEQADLLISLFGRHGESPAVVLAAASPGDCFQMAFEAVRLATKYMTPVLLLSDSFLANSAEPFRIPDPASLPDLRLSLTVTAEDFAPYRRDRDTLVRPWVAPGTRGFEHRIGGLEKEDGKGTVSYDGENHTKMVAYRAAKIARIAADVPPAEAVGAEQGDVLVVGWGSSYGAIAAAVEELRSEGRSVAQLHLRYLNPLPQNTGETLARFRRILVVEGNCGQLKMVLRNRFTASFFSLNQVAGRPFLIREVRHAIQELLDREHLEC